MAATNFDFPLFVGGTQVGLPDGSVNSRRPVPGGQVWYVGNLAASTSLKQTFAPGDGTTPDSALATLGGANGALAKLQNRKDCGDIIYILPGHVESVSAADYFSNTGTAAGFSIIGLGSGTARPTFNWTVAASTWLLDTPGVEIANCILNFAVTAATVVVTPITVSAANCRIVDCYINWGASTTVGCGSTLGAIAVTTAGDYFEFIGNFANNLDVAGTTGQAITLLSLNGADYCKIANNKIFGATTATTVGAIHFLTTLSSDVEIVGNYVENLIASSTIAISSAIAGVTGTIAYNQLRVNSGIQPITVSSNISCSLFQNFANNTVNKNGALVVGAGTSA
jgi:hypothetical protein